MIPIINNTLAFVGLAICTYFLLSDRFNTKSKETIIQLTIWISIWLILIAAALPNDVFQPSWTTLAARVLVLTANIWQFKTIIINRCKK